MPSFKSMDMPE